MVTELMKFEALLRALHFSIRITEKILELAKDHPLDDKDFECMCVAVIKSVIAAERG